MNEQINLMLNDASDLAVISCKETGELIEVYPGFFVKQTRTTVELTNGGRIFLRALCDDYMADRISVEELLNSFELIAESFLPSDKDYVYDKFYFEFLSMFEN